MPKKGVRCYAEDRNPLVRGASVGQRLERAGDQSTAVCRSRAVANTDPGSGAA